MENFDSQFMPFGPQWGFEIEYLPSASLSWPPSLQKSHSMPTDKEWCQLSDLEKQKTLQTHYEQKPYGQHSPVFKKESLSFLAEDIFFDDNGNLEIRQGPFDDFQSMKTSLLTCLQNLGQGSLQATLSLPRSLFFADSVQWQENLGLLLYFAECDILERIEEGYQSYLSGKTIYPIRPLTHPHLGPLNKRRYQWLRDYVEAQHKGGRFREKDLIRVGKREQSFKFIGATTYRPDIGGPERIAFEVRDAHTSVDKLFRKLNRLAEFIKKPRSTFLAYASIRPFDSEESWSLLPKTLQKGLKEVFPNQASAHIQEYPEPNFMYDVFRNFSLPLRDWETDYPFLTEDQNKRIQFLQQQYLNDLKKVFEDYDSKETQASKIQILLCDFFHKAPLSIPAPK